MGKNKQGARPHEKRAPYVDLSVHFCNAMPGLFGGFGIIIFLVFENGENKPSNLTSTFSHTNRTRNRIDFHSFRKERKKESKKKTGETTPLDYLLTSLHPHLARDRDRSIN